MQNSSQHLAQAAQVLQLIHFCAAPERTNQRQHYLHFIHSGSLAAGRLRWRVGRRIDSRAANSRGPPNQWDTLQVINQINRSHCYPEAAEQFRMNQTRSSGPSPGRPGPLQEVNNNAPHKYLCNKRLRTAKNIFLHWQKENRTQVGRARGGGGEGGGDKGIK